MDKLKLQFNGEDFTKKALKNKLFKDVKKFYNKKNIKDVNAKLGNEIVGVAAQVANNDSDVSFGNRRNRKADAPTNVTHSEDFYAIYKELKFQEQVFNTFPELKKDKALYAEFAKLNDEVNLKMGADVKVNFIKQEVNNFVAVLKDLI